MQKTLSNWLENLDVSYQGGNNGSRESRQTVNGKD